MIELAEKIVAVLKAQEPKWHGGYEEKGKWAKLTAERGYDVIVVRWKSEEVYDIRVNDEPATLREIKEIITAPYEDDEPEPNAVAELPPGHDPLPFALDDDDATILEALHGKTVVCAGVIVPDARMTHTVPVPSGGLQTPPRITRLAGGRVNVDYVDATGFHALRVNNIVKIKP